MDPLDELVAAFTGGRPVKITVPLLLWGVVASPLGYADTETIELSCALDVITQPPYGGSRHAHETAGVVLLLDPATGFKAIRIYAVTIPVAVANKKGGAVTSFVDNSSENRWDISNRRDRSKVASDESAVIDRTTGHITAHSMITVGDASQQVQAGGICTKVDNSKRKRAQGKSARDYAVPTGASSPREPLELAGQTTPRAVSAPGERSGSALSSSFQNESCDYIRL